MRTNAFSSGKVGVSKEQVMREEAVAAPLWWDFEEAFTIGRSRRCDIPIETSDDTRTVSKIHVRIVPMAPLTHLGNGTRRWILQDLDTMNGTAVNGVILASGGTIALHDCDEIVLASSMHRGVRVVVHASDAAFSRMYIQLLDGFGDSARRRQRQQQFLSPTRAVSLSTSSPQMLNFVSTPTRVRSSIAEVATPTTTSKRERDERESDPSEVNGTSRRKSTSAPSFKRTRLRDGPLTDDHERFMICSVCLEFFYASVTLPCSHTFCGHCITNWFRSSLSCPECRDQVKTQPVRNRALDDLVHRLVGDSDAYKSLIRSRSQTHRFQTAAGVITTSANGTTNVSTSSFLAPISVFNRWIVEEKLAFRQFLSKQFGEQRIASCREVGLTDRAIEAASSTELLSIAQNLLLEGCRLQNSEATRQRLKIFISFG